MSFSLFCGTVKFIYNITENSSFEFIKRTLYVDCIVVYVYAIVLVNLSVHELGTE